MTEHYCTYFDHRVAAKGLAMWKSLKRASPSAALHVLCLDEACRETLAGLALPDVQLHALKELEDSDPELLRARDTRNLVAYHFTLTPCLPLHIFKANPDVRRLTYVEADLFFVADPQPVLDEVGDHVVGLIEHRFPPDLADRERHGRFDVGWLTFRRDPMAVKCLEAWREQCIKSSDDRLEPGRFEAQKYLDQWPGRFEGVRIIQHRGADVAPWNLNRFEISTQGGRLRVGGQPMLFFHAHGFEPASPGRPRLLNLESYGVEATPMLLRAVFEPYEAAVLEETAQIAGPLAQALRSDQARQTVAPDETLRGRLSASERDSAARLDEIRTLQEQLAASEKDRALHLETIHALQKELAASQADLAGRPGVIATLQRQLEASEKDREGRLEVIHTQQKEIEASKVDRAARLDIIRTLQEQLEATRADHAARLDVIQTLKGQLEATAADHAARVAVIEPLQKELEVSEFDRSARMDVINTLQREVEMHAGNLKGTRIQLDQARAHIGDMERSRSWRWTRLVRWVESLVGNRDDRDDEG